MKATLLVNLGTPDAPTTGALRRYLRQFLSDPEVIDLPWLGRMLLVHGIIVPFRAPKSAGAYRMIWTDRGSPLRSHSEDLVEKVQNLLGADHPVALGMRYGNPSLRSALDRLRDLTRDEPTEINVVPLYPQYAQSTVKSTVDEIHRTLARMKWSPRLRIVPPFFRESSYLEAQAAAIRPFLSPDKHLLFSFHGVPERHILRSSPDCSKCLPQPSCKSLSHALCYRGQCYETAHGVAAKLQLSPQNYSISFQSRLGRTPWIRPYTDHHLHDLLCRGIKKIVVACPAFVADCLETLEEIGMRERERFMEAGGESFEVAPCMNSSTEWARSLQQLIESRSYGSDPEVSHA